MNGLGTPGVLPPFAIGLGAPTSLANAYGGGLPSLGAFALAQSGALGSATPAALRGLSNVLLVSNLNEEVINHFLYTNLYSYFSKSLLTQKSPSLLEDLKLKLANQILLLDFFRFSNNFIMIFSCFFYSLQKRPFSPT